jgi:hypothetical protein
VFVFCFSQERATERELCVCVFVLFSARERERGCAGCVKRERGKREERKREEREREEREGVEVERGGRKKKTLSLFPVVKKKKLFTSPFSPTLPLSLVRPPGESRPGPLGRGTAP